MPFVVKLSQEIIGTAVGIPSALAAFIYSKSADDCRKFTGEHTTASGAHLLMSSNIEESGGAQCSINRSIAPNTLVLISPCIPGTCLIKNRIFGDTYFNQRSA